MSADDETHAQQLAQFHAEQLETLRALNAETLRIATRPWWLPVLQGAAIAGGLMLLMRLAS